MKHNLLTVLGVVTLALAGVAALGVAIGAAIFSPAVPHALRSGEEISEVPVTQRAFDDRHAIDIRFVRGEERSVASPGSGRLTEFECAPGARLSSGTSSLSIDGQPVVSLQTRVPLWRDLHHGDRGDDVEALQTELARLGYAVDIDGIAGFATISATQSLFAERGIDTKNMNGIPSGRVLWIPSYEVELSSCSAATGDVVSEGDALAVLGAGLVTGEATNMPAGAVPGERIIIIDGERIPVDEQGRIVAYEALQLLASTPTYSAAVRAGESVISGALVLAEPVDVAVVPPGAIFGVDGNEACVAVDGEPRSVTLWGSELGQSFVSFDGDTPPHISMNPEGLNRCR